METLNPAHPGKIVRDDCLEPLGLSVTAAANALGITRKGLSDLLNGHTGISAAMAIRLENVFGSPARTWLQMERDLWEARQRADTIKVNRRFAESTSRRRLERRSFPGRATGPLFDPRWRRQLMNWDALRSLIACRFARP
jgi:addiction module HigA family antidote